MEGHVGDILCGIGIALSRGNTAGNTADVALICIDCDISQMQVLDDAVCAYHVEQADVIFAVAHNVEILDDVAVAVKRTVKARDSGRSLSLLRDKQTAVDCCNLVNRRRKHVLEIIAVCTAPSVLFRCELSVVISRSDREERVKHLYIIRRKLARYIFCEFVGVGERGWLRTIRHIATPSLFSFVVEHDIALFIERIDICVPSLNRVVNGDWRAFGNGEINLAVIFAIYNLKPLVARLHYLHKDLVTGVLVCGVIERGDEQARKRIDFISAIVLDNICNGQHRLIDQSEVEVHTFIF